MSDLKPSFADWLRVQLRERGWSESELARRAGVSRSAINLITNEKTSPGYEVASGIADAFGLRREDVFRIAGLLPPLSEAEDKALLEELVEVVKQLPISVQADVLEYARWRLERKTTSGQTDYTSLLNLIVENRDKYLAEPGSSLNVGQIESAIEVLKTLADKLRSRR